MTESSNEPEPSDQGRSVPPKFSPRSSCPQFSNSSNSSKKTDEANQSCFRVIGDTIPIGIFQTDAAGTPLFRNSTWCELTGESIDELPSRRWTEVIHPGDRDAVLEKWRHGLEHRMSWTTVCRFTPSDGTVRWIRVRFKPIVANFGAGGVVTAEDITTVLKTEAKLKQNASRLEMTMDVHEKNAARLAKLVDDLDAARQREEAAARIKGEFLANMSHEIRTPMTAILGYIDILIEENRGYQRNLDLLDVMKRNSEFLLEIINDILDLSKIEAGKMNTERIECAPITVVSDVISLMQVRAEAKNLPLEYEFSGAIPETVLTDPTRLRQILINLVGNAVKFTEQGSVRLITRFVPNPESPTSSGTLEFQVVDTGIGMSDKVVAGLFESFNQADATVTRQFGGTGLGLAISRRLANMLDGDISVQSALGSGSTFTATIAVKLLPGVTMIADPGRVLSDCDGAHPGEVQSQDLGESPLAGLKILLAEDGLDNQQLLSFLIKKAGGTVTVVENGQMACQAAGEACERDDPFDVILMDMQMPVLDGYRATQQLRQRGDTTPVIALTAHAMADARGKCLDAGCDDYVAKPIDRQKLYTTIIQQATARQESMKE